jgi:hypothetical protein
MARDHPGPAVDRLIVARLSGIAGRHALWGNLDEDQAAGAVAELRQVADGHGDLLAGVSGITLGASESKGSEYMAQGRAIAGLCITAGADEDLIAGWAEEGRRRAGEAHAPVQPVGTVCTAAPLSGSVHLDLIPSLSVN